MANVDARDIATPETGERSPCSYETRGVELDGCAHDAECVKGSVMMNGGQPLQAKLQSNL